MNQKELKELIEFLKEQDIAEFELERGDVKVRIKRGTPVAITPVQLPNSAPTVSTAAAAPPAAAPAAPSTSKSADEGLHQVKSPIVGTFYESASPGAPPFVRVGERVQPGKVLCIIESMKLMNEIESETSGIIESKLVMNGQPVEYGEALFSVRAV